MSKRAVSPAPLPSSKRLQVDPKSKYHRPSTPEITFDDLYDELVLHIFCHLSWVDLCTVQATNKKWSRLSTDNQLWKAVYLREYGRTRLRGAKGFVGRTDGRKVKPLPGRAPVSDVRDWKFMFRISSNWRTGRCAIEQWRDAVANSFDNYHTHFLLANNVTITASSRPCQTPEIHLHIPNQPIHPLPCRIPNSDQEPAHITALALDQCPPESENHLRIASFLSSGQFSVLIINHRLPSNSTRKLTYTPTFKTSRTAPIIQAAYHQPLLVTLSQGFHLSVYDLSADEISHTQTLTSFTSFPPTSLVLSSPSVATYKLVLAYAIPVYPAHWSVGVTELIISNSQPDHSAAAMGSTSPHVIATRTTRAFDVPGGWIDGNKLQSMREQWGRKVPGVADTQTDGKWVVLAPATVHYSTHPYASPPASGHALTSHDAPLSLSTVSSSLHSPANLQLYRLTLPAHHSASLVPKLTFVRNLFGPVGPVAALALADGRCVSLGVDGSVWVWDLEVGTGTEAARMPMDLGNETLVGSKEDISRLTQGAVVFDDKQIISASSSGVVVRRFDK